MKLNSRLLILNVSLLALISSSVFAAPPEYWRLADGPMGDYQHIDRENQRPHNIPYNPGQSYYDQQWQRIDSEIAAISTSDTSPENARNLKRLIYEFDWSLLMSRTEREKILRELHRKEDQLLQSSGAASLDQLIFSDQTKGKRKGCKL